MSGKLHTQAINHFLTTRPENELFFQNPIGTAYVSNLAYKGHNGEMILKGARVIKYGVGGPGFPDLVGFTLTEITPDMVGTVLPVFSTREIKTGSDKLRPLQKNWARILTGHGCYSKVILWDEKLKIFKEI